jgi:hypothetical protein
MTRHEILAGWIAGRWRDVDRETDLSTASEFGEPRQETKGPITLS